MLSNGLLIGMNGRFFPSNWRPALEEIAFARQNGFTAMQFQGKEGGLNAEHLGSSFERVGEALKQANITAVMEIVLRVDERGETASGKTPVEVLEANLNAITSLPCQYVHWHLVPLSLMDDGAMRTLERGLTPQLEQAVSLATHTGFRFGFEHNEPYLGLFAAPDACSYALDAVPGLGFVWDINHTTPGNLEAFQALIPKMTMLHVADTPLPEVNYHLPLGQGNVDFTAICASLRQSGFQGPAILEIGGLPKSGGYGKDTDEALINSLSVLQSANQVR